MEKYTLIKEIGSGSFGKVFLVKSKQQGINYVVKKIDLSKLDKKQILSASKEVELLAKLKHNNIVTYKESYEKNNELNIILEYCENGDLHNKIKEKRISGKHFAENEIFDYFVQISLALEYIHSQKILHRDLKTKNIFLTKGNIIKLGDFGIAKTLENSFELAQTCIGSPFYLSPEICESKPYNKKSDVWALGCVLYEIATLRYAFTAKNVKTLVTKILTGAYSPLPTNMDIHIRSLISCMLKPNPMDRPSVKEILEKRFLIKRRTKFICKTYYKRSKSGEGRNVSSAIVKNEFQKNSLNAMKFSSSCLQLNHLKDLKKINNLSNPQTKYDPLNISRCWKNDKKIISTNYNRNENTKNICSGDKNEELNFESKKPEKSLQNCESNCKNLSNLKNIKLPKVNSEYYNLIVGRNRHEFDKKDDFVGEQIAWEESGLNKINTKPDTKSIGKIKCPQITREIEESGDFYENHQPEEEIQEKKLFPNSCETVSEHRKRWSNNTLQREELLAIFNESELLDSCLIPSNDNLGSPMKTVDEMLSLNQSEITEDVLKPVRVYETEPEEKNSLQLLQNEVDRLREKFEWSNRNYQIEDLMRLTCNSRNILKLGIQKCTEFDKKIDESVYHDLECMKMALERKIGFTCFFETYGKMIDIITDDLNSTLKTSLKKPIDPTKTYVIGKMNVAGGHDDEITWKSIIGILGDKQEYLPDVWELAMSENIYYHL